MRTKARTPLANIIISAQEQEKRFSFPIILQQYNACFMLYTYGYYGIFFSMYFPEIYNPEVTKYTSFCHSLLKPGVVTSNHGLPSPLL